jgi:hypothetical protein
MLHKRVGRPPILTPSVGSCVGDTSASASLVMDHCRDTPGPPRNRCEEQSPKALQANQSGLQPPMLICTAKRQRELLFYVIFYIMHASSGTYVAHTIQHCTGCAYKNSGTYFLSCHQTSFFLTT